MNLLSISQRYCVVLELFIHWKLGPHETEPWTLFVVLRFGFVYLYILYDTFYGVSVMLTVVILLQNTTSIWEVEDPDFTICFEKTVLVWVPCIFLWCFSPIEIVYIANSKEKAISWTWIHITKQVSFLFISFLSTGNIGRAF